MGCSGSTELDAKYSSRTELKLLTVLRHHNTISKNMNLVHQFDKMTGYGPITATTRLETPATATAITPEATTDTPWWPARVPTGLAVCLERTARTTTHHWTRKVNGHVTIEAHPADDVADVNDAPYLVLVRGGNPVSQARGTNGRLWVELSEVKALIEALADEAARLAGVVAGDIEPGGGGNGGK